MSMLNIQRKILDYCHVKYILELCAIQNCLLNSYSIPEFELNLNWESKQDANLNFEV